MSQLSSAFKRIPRNARIRRCLGVLSAVSLGFLTVWLIRVGYRHDFAGAFYLGWVGSAAVGLWLKRLFSESQPAQSVPTGGLESPKESLFQLVLHNAVHSWLLLVGVVVLGDGWWTWRTRNVSDPPPAQRAYSFEAAQGDPRVFRNWWAYYLREWGRFFQHMVVAGPPEGPAFRLIPNQSMKFANSEYFINSFGFRNREVPFEKGERFRIIALGESTTMGITLEPEDRPWTEWLESLIGEHCGEGTEVEVLNAGVAAHTLADSLARFDDEILPLKPDLLLSYHGYNGFPMLQGTGLQLHEMPPELPPRPSAVLGRVEAYWHMRAYQQRRARQEAVYVSISQGDAGARDSDCGLWHQELIRRAGEAGVPVVFLSFNMAINLESSDAVVDFYRDAFVWVTFYMHANRIHNHMTRNFAEEHDSVFFVDTSDGLDGEHRHFIDLVHLTESGREQLARNIFRGLRPLLRPCTP